MNRLKWRRSHEKVTLITNDWSFLKKRIKFTRAVTLGEEYFGDVGENVKFQPRLIPLHPELIKLHNNIVVAAGVRFGTLDTSYTVLSQLGLGRFPEHVGCIELMDNVFVGYNAKIFQTSESERTALSVQAPR